MTDIMINNENFIDYDVDNSPGTWLKNFYNAQIDEVLEYLKNGVNVLIKGDVEISTLFTQLFKEKFSSALHANLHHEISEYPPLKIPPRELPRGIPAYCHMQLLTLWNTQDKDNDSKKRLVVLRSLETLIAMLSGELQNTTYELAFVLNDLQDRCVFLGISDPSGPSLPSTLKALFPKIVILKGVTGDNIAGLLTLREARMLGTGNILKEEDRNKLADCVKGLNPLSFRRRLKDAMERHGGNRELVYEHLKRLTMSTAQMESIDRPIKVCGYESVIGPASPLRNFFIDPYKLWLKTGDMQLTKEMFKGILLYGIPGTGKTLIAKWIASELKMRIRIVAPYDIKGSLLGQSERNVQRIFEDARRFAPCILVFDEMDDLFKERESRDVGSGIRSTLLSEMAGINEQTMVFIIGTTNKRNVVDEAFLRTSRLSLQIEIPPPNEHDRQEILTYYAESMKINGLGLDDNAIKEISKIDGIPSDPNVGNSSILRIVGDHLYGLCRRIFLSAKPITIEQIKVELETVVRMAHR
jgi:transitional endoplasmic reticulum ATPase